jgi:hypothetical protein
MKKYLGENMHFHKACDSFLFGGYEIYGYLCGVNLKNMKEHEEESIDWSNDVLDDIERTSTVSV